MFSHGVVWYSILRCAMVCYSCYAKVSYGFKVVCVPREIGYYFWEKVLLSAPRSSRLGRHGKVFLTIPSQSSTDEQKFIQKGEAPGSDSLFDLDPEDTVFFVGGFPQTFTVAAASLTHNICVLALCLLS